jgi:hypothetical protein
MVLSIFQIADGEEIRHATCDGERLGIPGEARKHCSSVGWGIAALEFCAIIYFSEALSSFHVCRFCVHIPKPSQVIVK